MPAAQIIQNARRSDICSVQVIEIKLSSYENVGDDAPPFLIFEKRPSIHKRPSIQCSESTEFNYILPVLSVALE
jgi:hypothetical protein